MRSLAAVLLATLLAQGVGAQTRVGARAGYVWARQIDDFGASSALPGASVGLSVAEDFATWIGIEVDLLYTQKGWREGSAWVGLDYVEIPMLLRLAVPLSDIDHAPDLGVQPFVVVGPNFAFRVHCSDRRVFENPNSGDRFRVIVVGGRPVQRQFPVECSAYERPHDDSGIAYGGGLTVRRTRTHISAEFRQFMGYADLRSGPGPRNCTRCKLTSRATSVLLAASLRVR